MSKDCHHNGHYWFWFVMNFTGHCSGLFLEGAKWVFWNREPENKHELIPGVFDLWWSCIEMCVLAACHVVSFCVYCVSCAILCSLCVLVKVQWTNAAWSDVKAFDAVLCWISITVHSIHPPPPPSPHSPPAPFLPLPPSFAVIGLLFYWALTTASPAFSQWMYYIHIII